MKIDKFFKWVWNINGLILLIGASILTIIIAYQLTKDFFREEARSTQTLSLAEDSKGEENWSLGYPEYIEGSDYYYLPLESDTKEVETKSKVYNLYSSGYSATRAKNVIFLNSITNDSTWLFESVKQIIINMNALPFRMENDQVVTKAIYYEVINNDTNKDGVFDINDKRTFSLTKDDGSSYSEIISGYNSIVKASLNKDGKLFVVYINNDEVHSMLIELDEFTVIDQKQLPKVKSS